MSSRLRVATCTSSPRRWTWIRIPSSFTSTATWPPPAFSIAAGTSGALEASIGRTGRPTSSPTSASASAPPVIAATTIGTVPPASIAARRTTVSLTPEAAAIASCTRASSAPWRTLPVRTPRSQRCSSAVARANRRADAGRPRLLRPGPGQGREVVEGLVDVERGQGRLVGRLGQRADPAPADAGAPLEHRAAEVGRHDGQLGDLRLRQPLGDRGDLGLARPGGRDHAGGLDQVAQQHVLILPETADALGRHTFRSLQGLTPYDVPATRRCGCGRRRARGRT